MYLLRIEKTINEGLYDFSYYLNTHKRTEHREYKTLSGAQAAKKRIKAKLEDSPEINSFNIKIFEEMSDESPKRFEQESLF